MTSLPPSIAAVPESPSPGASPPPVVAFPVQEGEAPLLSVESASVATTPNHLNRPFVSKDSSKTKSTAEELWQPDLAWSPHRQPGIETAATAQSMDPCHPSPTIGWPQRSPMKPDHEVDVASFTLFTQSFDTLSETGHFLRHATSAGLEQQPEQFPRKIDVAARADTQGNWVGDISPIKLGVEDNYHDTRSRLHHYHGAAPPNQHHYEGHYHYSYSHYEDSATSPRSNPFFVLRSAHRAFDGFSYLLPCLENREICPISISTHASIRLCRDERTTPDNRDVVMARRRVETAIHAFGGYMKPKHVTSNHESIFRLKGCPKSPWKKFYDDTFHRRYAVNANHISWELELNPPVCEEDASTSRARRLVDLNIGIGGGDGTIARNEHGSPLSTVSVVTAENQLQKMKYRCKLCGQLKQNHNCPYQQSLQRSIGVMVYPAVNAYTSMEPGVFAKSLSEMNNFVSYESSSKNTSECVQQPHVTPETKARDLHSSESSLSTAESIDRAPNRSRPSYNGYPRQSSISQVAARRKRTNSQMCQEGNDNPHKKNFVKTLTLRPEHFRAVTPRSKDKHDSAEFQYPHVALTFRERKRLSDTLFFLSKEIPNTTIPVASLLRAARDKNEWDLSVAELLTQIVVGLYCREGDHELDGLQDYLMRLGVSC